MYILSKKINSLNHKLLHIFRNFSMISSHNIRNLTHEISLNNILFEFKNIVGNPKSRKIILLSFLRIFWHLC